MRKRYSAMTKPYYRYNVNHPLIRPLYIRFKRKAGVPEHFPPSDRQREEFEGHMDKLYGQGKLPSDVLVPGTEAIGQQIQQQTKEKDL